MFNPSNSGADAPTPSAASIPPSATIPSSTPLSQGHVRHLLLGPVDIVQNTIRLLHKLGYAEVNDWSRPISTGRPNEVMAILTKRVGPLAE
jgi:hypothetical protein